LYAAGNTFKECQLKNLWNVNAGVEVNLLCMNIIESTHAVYICVVASFLIRYIYNWIFEHSGSGVYCVIGPKVVKWFKGFGELF